MATDRRQAIRRQLRYRRMPSSTSRQTVIGFHVRAYVTCLKKKTRFKELVKRELGESHTPIKTRPRGGYLCSDRLTICVVTVSRGLVIHRFRARRSLHK